MITLITGVPGTGKTALVVSMLEQEILAGRVVFTNISGLKLPHYKLGNMTEWQKGTWLHIDEYVRCSPSIAMESASDENNENDRNWLPRDDVMFDEAGNLRRIAFDKNGQAVGSVEYESHKGALIVYDECQNTFRPRAAGSAVPDCVSALEVHRKQGLDFWMITQRPLQVDSNLRGLCGRHIALRDMALGRFKYEWPEVGDIESKMSRDNAARSRFKLPKHVFPLYDSAEVHTRTSHKLPLMAKVAFAAVPAAAFFLWQSYSVISGKFAVKPPISAAIAAPAQPVKVSVVSLGAIGSKVEPLPDGFEAWEPAKIKDTHPYAGSSFVIMARITSATRDLWRFGVISGGGMVSSHVSSDELIASGYSLLPLSDCSVKVVYGKVEFFVTCDRPFQSSSWQPVSG